MAALHELAGLEVCSHGLVVLVLNGEAVAVCQPSRPKQAIQLCGLTHVPAQLYRDSLYCYMNKIGMHQISGRIPNLAVGYRIRLAPQAETSAKYAVGFS